MQTTAETLGQNSDGTIQVLPSSDGTIQFSWDFIDVFAFGWFPVSSQEECRSIVPADSFKWAKTVTKRSVIVSQ
jgi:hypothetical protein